MQIIQSIICLIAFKSIHTRLQYLTIFNDSFPTFAVGHDVIVFVAKSTLTSPQRVYNGVANWVVLPPLGISAGDARSIVPAEVFLCLREDALIAIFVTGL